MVCHGGEQSLLEVVRRLTLALRHSFDMALCLLRPLCHSRNARLERCIEGLAAHAVCGWCLGLDETHAHAHIHTYRAVKYVKLHSSPAIADSWPIHDSYCLLKAPSANPQLAIEWQLRRQLLQEPAPRTQVKGWPPQQKHARAYHRGA